MATTQLFVNVSAGSLAAGLVRSLTDMTPVGFPELVIGDGRTYELYFVDGKGGYAAFSGNAAYIPEIAIGNCGTPTGGTFTLKFGANTTGALAYNASAATVQAALEALTSIGSGNCSVSGQGPNYFVVTFKGALAAAPQALIVADPTNLTPSANISVSTLVPGMASPATNAVQVLVLAVNPISFANTWTAITNGWTGKLSTATVAALQAFAAAGATITEIFQITVLDPAGVASTYVKTPATIECTIINPSAMAGPDAPNLVTAAQLAAAVLGLNNFTQESIASSAAGNSNVTRASTSRLHTALITVTGVANTRTFAILTSASPNAGDKVMLYFLTPATAGIVLEIHNATAGGTLLETVTTTISTETFFMVFGYSGSAWELEFTSYDYLAKIGNLAGISSPIAARLNLKSLFSKGATKSANFTAADTEDGYWYGCNAATGAILATLPNAATVGEGFLICLQKTDSGVQVVTTSPATATLSYSGQSIVLRSDGTNWNVVLAYSPQTVAVTTAQAILNFYTVSGLTGGGSTNLDGQATSNGALPAYAIAVLAYGTPRASQMWQLVPGVDAAASGIIRPTDFDSSLNPQVWKQIA
jgi:hypothetical protein